LRDINARNIIFDQTGIRSLENISLKGNLHRTNIFLTLPRDADEELVAGITNTLIPELAGKIAVSPVERAAREAERIRLSRRLEETNTLLEQFTGLLTTDEPPESYLSRDLDQLKLWKEIINKHLSTAALYIEALSSDAISSLPRIALDAVWYRLSRFGDFTPEAIPTRFNPGTGQYPSFKSLALAEDMPTAMFELTRNVDLADTAALLRRSLMTELRVALTNVADLTDPDTIKSVLGIDFEALMGMSFPGKLSVTQKICTILVRCGTEGAIFPSRTTVGRKNLVVFPSNLPGGRPLTTLFSGRLATDKPDTR
jgi:hypothetical protein